MTDQRDHIKYRERCGMFTQELRKIAPQFKWHRDEFGAIRARCKNLPAHFCPITAMFYTEHKHALPINRMHEAAERLGFGDIATRIVEAMDNMPAGPGARIDGTLREQILQAVGLKD